MRGESSSASGSEVAVGLPSGERHGDGDVELLVVASVFVVCDELLFRFDNVHVVLWDWGGTSDIYTSDRSLRGI